MTAAPTLKKELEQKLEATDTQQVNESSALVPANPDDFQPCNWSLTSEGGDLISGVNLRTGRRFEGTVLEFNKYLTGA